ncbi:MAG: prepilin-type N-terminal cleavage/methylation domain-containing protein [Sulfurimonas sp.]|nr:prepilin-type N-terminal cleavage/methylation domain-containing protein [Sulfurimonas sp.]
MTGKSAFTLIELIFVIILLSILAAVAIPKLSAVRADAEASAKAHMAMTAVTEIVSFAVAKGHTEPDLSKMSNSILVLVNSGDAVLDIANYKAVISTGSAPNCLSIQIFTDDLNVTFGDANSDNECMTIQSLIDVNVFPVKLSGTRVVY